MLVHMPKDCIEKKFKALGVGDLFIYDKTVAMKIARVIFGSAPANSISLHEGAPLFLRSDTLVKSVDGELHVSYFTKVDK